MRSIVFTTHRSILLWMTLVSSCESSVGRIPRAVCQIFPDRAEYYVARHEEHSSCSSLAVNVPRGGASRDMNSGAGPAVGLVKTVRTISPLLANILTSFFRLFETLLGIRLLPKGSIAVDTAKLKTHKRGISAPKTKKSKKKSTESTPDDKLTHTSSKTKERRAPSGKKSQAARKSASSSGGHHLQNRLVLCLVESCGRALREMTYVASTGFD
jgi:hypothetical protein